MIDERKGILNRYETAPESSKQNPIHPRYNKYIKDRKIVDKMKDGVYNYFNKKVKNNEENIKENRKYDYDTNSKTILQSGENADQQIRRGLGSKRGRLLDNSLPTAKSNKAPKYSLEMKTELSEQSYC